MKRILLNIIALLLFVAGASAQGLIETPGAFLEQLQQRDTVLIADQLRYGFTLEGVEEGTRFMLPELQDTLMRDVDIVRGWQIDTLKTVKKPQLRRNIQGSMVIAPWEEGEYHLPRLALLRIAPDGKADTLVFDEQVMQVYTMPVDTATFEIRDIKAPANYPVTPDEVIPFVALAWLLIVLGIAIWCIVSMRKRRQSGEVEVHREPAYIVALRKLDHFRGDKYWAADKQKAFYSGVTDALREYIEARFGVDALEMTTAEIFVELKGNKELTPELYAEAKELFEVADFVKFAKHTVSDEENAKVLPTAVRFVTSTYQTELEQESGKNEKEG